MDKNTLIAVVLSVIVIVSGMFIQNFFFAPDPSQVSETAQRENQREPQRDDVTKEPAQIHSTPLATGIPRAEELEIEEQEFLMETDLFIARFSNRGGDLVSLQLKEHRDFDLPLEMIYTGDSDSRAFSMRFGDMDAPRVDDLFVGRVVNSTTLEFSREFRSAETDIPFTLKKRYVMHPGQYMIALEIIVQNSVSDIPRLGVDGYAYTLEMAPQIGPRFEKLDGRTEYRRFYTLNGGKRREVRTSRNGVEFLNERVNWAAVVGKYFAIAGILDTTPYTIVFSDNPLPGLEDTSRIMFSRPPIRSSMNSDLFRFYVGPKTPPELRKFDSVANNSFNLSNMELKELIDQGRFLGWLETILKTILELFYRLVPNYGIAIILLTIVIKVILFPFTHKSFEATSKMQQLAPKIEELKAKHKDNPNKMNAAMAELYKKEGANPLGGCLPMLLQMPIFFALYGLLNKHFDLRGAVFISGWITDLSLPESIFQLPFTIPLLNWQDIRLLPIIYVVTQILYSQQMAAGNANTNKQMQMMTKMMPLMFFFILYNMPSGLLVYWIMQNVLTSIQQFYITRYMKKKAH